MDFLYIKAIHIIFVVTWFSGMFYLVRLFIYNREANDKEGLEKEILQKQFAIMIKRLLFGITWPSAILTLIMGLYLLYIYPAIPMWLVIKLVLVTLLFLYHYTLHIIYKQQTHGNFKYNSQQLRLWNEVPTVFLVAIVMIVVVKQNMSIVYGLVGLVALIVLLMSGIKIYKLVRRDWRR
jgi:putative membrane protein